MQTLVDMTNVTRVGSTLEITIPYVIWPKLFRTGEPGLLLYNTLAHHQDKITLGQCQRLGRIIVGDEDIKNDMVDIFFRDNNKVDIWMTI